MSKITDELTAATEVSGELLGEDGSQHLAVDDVIAAIQKLQGEILEREEQIAALVEAAERPSVFENLVEEAEERRRMRHLERLVGDWDSLVARSRAVSEDDIDLVAALVRLVGDLLVIQHDGLDTKWVSRLEAYISDQRAKVS
ncbi:MAG: hypothetical protein AAF657_15305 [Acidobacteriota bacterium]